jgi:cell division GTPase FtsZ
MNTIRRYAVDDAHVIYGTAYDETLGDQLRVTVIATGLSRTCRTGLRRPEHPQRVAHQPHARGGEGGCFGKQRDGRDRDSGVLAQAGGLTPRHG